MKDFFKNLIYRFTSRKFLLALGAFITASANGEWGVALSIVLAYMGVEGVADAVERNRK